MSKYSIKVNILNRPFPLLVESEEESTVRKAAKLINEKVKGYKENFSVKDDLDLVIMCCLELATDNIQQYHKQNTLNQSSEDQLGKLHHLIDEIILKTEEI